MREKAEDGEEASAVTDQSSFLYNTLDSIIWMIRSEEYDGAGRWSLFWLNFSGFP